MRIQLILLSFFVTFAFATLANEVKIHVITPKLPISWSSPSALALSTAANSVSNDYAPIGHFIVEIKCNQKNQYGINHILTGMERVNRKESQVIIMREKLGLGSLTYSFKGALQTSTDAKHELLQAGRDKRLYTITLPILEENCMEALSFVDDWINNGSFKIYGGGKDTAAGEGAGCADFATTIFKITTGVNAPKSWFADILVPYHLIGKVPYQNVSFTDVLLTTNWATNETQGLKFKIADTNKTVQWMRRFTKSREYTLSKLKQGMKIRSLYGNTYQRPAFKYHYPTNIQAQDLWKSIEL